MYDYIIIGAGPGGMDTALEAKRQGASVLLVEKEHIGGTCLNKGCIPTKALLHSAASLASLRKMKDLGQVIFNGKTEINLVSIIEHKDSTVLTLRQGAESTLKGIETVKGKARLAGAHEVEIDGNIYEGERIIIATGSQPARLNIPGAESALTSDEVLTLPEIWYKDLKSFIIIGGGVIGIEFCTILKSLFPEAEITVVEYLKEIVPALDKEVAKRLRMSMSRNGIKFITGASVKEIVEGHKVVYDRNGVNAEISADCIIMTTGRRPVFPEGLNEIGVETTSKGIIVDEKFRTSVPSVYAIGDVTGKLMLAHVATAQGKRLLGFDVDLDIVPSTVFSIPECSMVGLNEENCKAEGRDYSVRKAFFRANGKAVCQDETEGMVKILTDNATGQIIGVHIMGPHASDIIAECVLAMTSHLTASAIIRTIHAHPTLNEIIPTALNE